jgi:xylan 1,4-beta-xylosidase
MLQYHNPVLPGFHPDPSICRRGSDYYLAVSSFEYFPGVPLFHSTNLINWELEGYALSRPGQLELAGCAPSAGIYAPTLRWNNEKFFMVTTNTSAKGHLLVSAERAEGPWSDPVTIRQDGIDPSILFDGDTVYFCCNNLGAEGRQGIFLSEINVTTGETLTKPVCISYGSGGRYVEGPHLYHIGRYYYLMLSEGGTEYGHMVTIFRAVSPYGPYEACPRNPILTHRDAGGYPIQATGHADLVETEAGKWWLVCLGIRPQPGCLLHHLGRETFLSPVEWDSAGWPHVNRDRMLSESMEGPLPQKPAMQYPDFCDALSGKIRPEWRTLRVPLDEKSEKQTDRGLVLTSNGVALSEECKTPVFLCIPQSGFHIRCEVTVQASGETDACAGLSMFYGADYHYDIYLQTVSGKGSIHFRKRLCETEEDRGSFLLPEGQTDIRLAVEADEKEYRFYAEPGKQAGGRDRVLLGTGLTAGLSTEGTHYMSFTGVMAGIFCEKGSGVFSLFSMRERSEEKRREQMR